MRLLLCVCVCMRVYVCIPYVLDKQMHFRNRIEEQFVRANFMLHLSQSSTLANSITIDFRKVVLLFDISATHQRTIYHLLTNTHILEIEQVKQRKKTV